ncbi:MAG: sigma 54-interacting transcriptional regulator [Kiritimatiellae bacterium]|jgi:Nif-specific regulatory protein|nr:sigma 54-interacting transcriptional regulator [Kiritimatiellia bacterium]
MTDNVNNQSIDMDLINDISQIMTQKQQVVSLLFDILVTLSKRANLVRGAFTLKESDTDVYKMASSYGIPPEQQTQRIYYTGQGIIGKVAQTKNSIITKDIRDSKEFDNKIGFDKKKKFSHFCIPILFDNTVIGTLSIYSENASKDDILIIKKFLFTVTNIIATHVSVIRSKIAEQTKLEEENRKLKAQFGEIHRPNNIIGNSPQMQHVYKQIQQVSMSTATTLLRGQSGTGKELVAQAIHNHSQRRNEKLLAVNCSALAENLIESELFGHEKGAFTGASAQRKGRFEEADGGTIFLDEIGDISLAVQARLLRVLQEQTFERVGSNKTIKVNVRVIAATSKNLEEAMKKGEFREDLFYRLNVFSIQLPPLKDRVSDIIPLCEFFYTKYNKEYGKNVTSTSPSAQRILLSYEWPGNVRELGNCIERAVLTCNDSEINSYNLPPDIQDATMGLADIDGITEQDTDVVINGSFKDMVSAYEKKIIEKVLKENCGNAAAAARELKTTPRIINYKIAQFEIGTKDFK